MAFSILLLTWAGVELDEYLGFGFPAFTLLFSLLSVAGSLIYLVRTLSKP
jgi:hypothetical protein